MKLITRETDYAIRALCQIAQRQGGGAAVVDDINKKLKIPRPFLRKILRILAGSGVLFSSRGNGGGYHLARPPQDIRLIDVITAFQGTFKINECIFKKRVCPSRQHCLLRSKITDIERRVREELGAVTLASLCGKEIVKESG